MPKPIIRSRRWWGGIVALAALPFLGGCRTCTPEAALTLPTPDYLRHAPIFMPSSPGFESSPGIELMKASIPESAAQLGLIKDPYIAELLVILQETNSVDAFLTTLNLLVDAHPDHRLVIPTVIRNAERLRLYADHALKDTVDLKTGIAEEINKAIARLTHTETGSACEKRPPSQGQITPMEAWVADPIEERLKNSHEMANVRTIAEECEAELARFALSKEFLETYDNASPKDRKNRSPVLPPIPAGCTPTCEAPPDREEILRMIARLARRAPHLRQVYGDDMEFAVEKLVDRVDPPRFFPLIGPAQMHHCHWKCTIYYTETVEGRYPFPFEIKKRRTEVVYFDKDHLHLCVCKPEKPEEGRRP